MAAPGTEPGLNVHQLQSFFIIIFAFTEAVYANDVLKRHFRHLYKFFWTKYGAVSVQKLTFSATYIDAILICQIFGRWNLKQNGMW